MSKMYDPDPAPRVEDRRYPTKARTRDEYADGPRAAFTRGAKRKVGPAKADAGKIIPTPKPRPSTDEAYAKRMAAKAARAAKRASRKPTP